MPLTPEDYLAAIFDHLTPTRLGTETVPLTAALGRTLADDVVARLSVPAFDNSAMDGFAVQVSDFAGEGPWTFAVIDEIAAGSLGKVGVIDAAAPATDAALPRAARIMTGAPMPEWADAVVKVEDTDAPAGASELPKTVAIHAAPKPGLNVRYAGEDLSAGTLALETGSVLSARSLSALASIGYGEVEVVRRPRVAVIATGSELAAPGAPLEPGMIPDSNSSLLWGLVAEAGGEATVHTATDTADAFGEALDAISPEDADLIVTSGGVSMGAFDPVKEYGLSRGWTFEKVAMQPGKPQGHGRSSAGIPVISLPGNPVSVAVSFRLFVRPFLARLLGQPADAAPRVMPAGADWSCPQGRRQYMAAKLVREGDHDVVVPVHERGSGSHLVAALHYAEVLAIVPAETEEVHRGDLVEVVEL